MPLAASVIWNPMISIAIYVALGLAVLASRLLFPAAKAASTAAQAPQQPTVANEHSEMAKAA
jgi:hypothetical protein